MLEWLAPMQHHGAPTRLLDWSYTLEIGAFFAIKEVFESPDADAAVWAVNDHWCKAQTMERLRGSRSEDAVRLLANAITSGDEPALAAALLGEPAIAFAFPVAPFRLNERLTVQKGVFLIVGDVTKRFEDNLGAMAGVGEHNVAKLVIPGECAPNFAEELYDLNIGDATLFPGLDGYARSLKMNARFLQRRRRMTE